MEGNNIISRYNKLFFKINGAKTVDDIRNLYDEVKKFEITYKLVDKETVKKVNELFLNRMNDMVTENEIIHQGILDKIEEINKTEFDYSKDKDDSQAVQAKVLELMSKLPKQKTLANTGTIAQTIGSTIKSGSSGAKAVLELLKYPAYVDMVDERFRQQAFIASKSTKQIQFETKKELDLEKMNQANAQAILQGFHLRTIQKKFVESKKSNHYFSSEEEVDYFGSSK
jgi:hypothetical protein